MVMVIRSNAFIDDAVVPYGLLHPSMIARIERDRPDLVDHPKLQNFFQDFHKYGPLNAMEYMANPSIMSILVELMMTTTSVTPPRVGINDDTTNGSIARNIQSIPFFRRGRFYAVKF